ncbi:MAG: response regulator transcription factor [Verrucomicrobiae bacterium]|nr:response regulator transcription factor [Verrucomicrobiae bacterium]
MAAATQGRKGRIRQPEARLRGTPPPVRSRGLPDAQGSRGGPTCRPERIPRSGPPGRIRRLGEYFPLGTSHAAAALRLARRLQRELRRDGIAGVCSRHSREATVALHWSANPLLWTYFSLHTRPTPPWQPPHGPIRNRAAAWRLGVIEPEPGLGNALAEALAAGSAGHEVTLWHRPLEAPAGLERQAVDLVLVNHVLDGTSGTELISRLRLLRPQAAFIEYSVYRDSDELFRSTPGGASIYVLCRTSWDQVLEPLEECPRPQPGESPRWTRHVQEYFQNQVRTPNAAGRLNPLPSLTPREIEILGLMARGLVDKEIAQELRISVWTVHGHAKRIYEKLGVHSRTEAVVRYLQK